MKSLNFNEEQTENIYFLFVHIEHLCKKEYEQEVKLLLKGYLTHEDLKITRERYALSKILLDFFREARTTFISELPF